MIPHPIAPEQLRELQANGDFILRNQSVVVLWLAHDELADLHRSQHIVKQLKHK